MSDRARHRRLYRRIPIVACEPGCSDCCGPAPISPYEAGNRSFGAVLADGRQSA